VALKVDSKLNHIVKNQDHWSVKLILASLVCT
jgi:hypothetical protein